MRTMITTVLLAASMLASAQQNSGRATKLRLVGHHAEQFASSVWANTDSSRNIYVNPHIGIGEYENFFYDTTYSYNYTGTGWNVSAKSIFSYTSGMTAFYEYQSYNGTTFVPMDRSIRTYTATGKIQDITVYTWDGTVWNNYDRELNTYDANDNRISRISQTWNAGAWVNNTQSVSTYDGNNNLTASTRQNWTSGAWANDERLIYTYNASNNAESRVQQDWSAGTWNNTQKNEYIYGPNSLTETTNSFNWTSGAWAPTYRYSYVYNGNNLMTTSTTYQYIGSTWVNKNRQINDYDINDRQTQELTQTYTGGVWVNQSRFQQQYNSYGLVTYNDQYGYAAGNWEGVRRVYLSYEEYDDNATGISGVDELGRGTVFPNPFAQNTMLSFDNPQAGEVSITISSLNGQSVFNTKQYYPEGTQQILIDASSWAKGMYMANITGGTAKANIKLVKQ